MKIIEIIDEGVMDVVKGVAKGASAFVAGAGGPDIEATWNKYIKTPAGTTRSINADLPPQEQFDRILPAIYGKSNVSGELKQDWVDAINSGDRKKIEALGQKYRELRRSEGLDNDKLKKSHTTVIDDLIRMAKSGEVKFTAQAATPTNPDKEKKPADDEKDKEEKL